MDAGDTDGFDDVDVKPDGELTHEYVCPAVDAAPMDMGVFKQTEVFAITEAEGSGLTVMVTALELTQPLEFVSVTV